MLHRLHTLIILLALPMLMLGNRFESAQMTVELSEKNASKTISGKLRHSLNLTTPFIALSAVVEGSDFLHEDFELFVFAALDGEQKKRWIPLEHDHHVEHSDNKIHFPPVYLNASTKSFRFKIIRKNNASSFSKISFQLFVPANVQVNENGVVDMDEGDDASRACSCAQPSSVGRSNWGSAYNLTANSSCNSLSYTTVSHLIVHHSAGSNSSTNWAGVVASIWNYHVNTNGWCDVGYNWLIDPNGVLYVGRGGGNNVVGAHMCGYNQKTMAVCLLGTYTSVNPTQVMLDKLTQILAWKCCNSNIDPLGSGPITSYPGTMNNISGHRQGCSPGYTSCPGNSVFNLLGSIRTSVSNYITNGCSTSTQPSNPVNDYCSGAINLTSSTTCNYQTFSTTNATGSLPATSPCNGFTNGNADDDVWFTFTAVSNQHTVRLLNGTSFDGVLDVRNGCYSSSVSIGCDDQTGSTGVLNTVTLNNLTIGTVYYVRAYHYGTGSGGGSFQLCVTHPQPSCNAPSGRTTTNITATSASLSWSAVSGASNYEVWYKAAGATNYTKTTTANTSLALNNLSCNTTYEWSVMTYCTNGTNSGAPSSFTTFTTPNDLPNATISHTATGYSVAFSANVSGNPTAFSWNFGDGSPASTQQNPTHVYPSTGVPTNYIVTLTLTNYCGSRNITYNFTLTPVCSFALSSNSVTLDSNQHSIQVTLTNTAQCPWTASANCNFVSIIPASGTLTTVVEIAIAENNDTATRTCDVTIGGETFTITQNGKVVPVNCTFTLTPDTIFVDSSAQQVSVQLNNPNNCNWSLVNGCAFAPASPTSGNASQLIQINFAENFDTLQRQCNMLIADKNLVIIQSGKQPPVIPCQPPLPQPPVVLNGCDLASSPAIANVTYSWFRNGVLIQGASTRFFTVEDDKGYYYVMITDAANCTAQSDDVYVDCVLPPLGAGDLNEADLFASLFFNPTERKIIITSNLDEQLSIHVYNALGQQIYHGFFYAEKIINTEMLSDGVYFIHLRSRNASATRRVLLRQH